MSLQPFPNRGNALDDTAVRAYLEGMRILQTTRVVAGTAGQVTVTNGNFSVSNTATVALATDAIFPGTGANTLITGTTAQRPSTPTDAMIRYNSSTSVIEFYSSAAWNSIQAADPTLAALAAYNTNGLITQTAADTFTGRTITGTAGTISVTNGSGVSGNPTLTIDANYVGQTTITTVGTITTGTWTGTAIALANGGTNANLTASNGGIFYSTASAAAILSGTATAGKVLQSGAAVAPTWSTPTYPSTSDTSGKVLISDGTNNVYSTSTMPSSAGATANKVLLSDGVNYILSTPTFPNASATTLKHIRSDGTNWVASTVTYPDASVTAGKVMISDGTNYIASTPTYPNTSATTLKYLKSDGTNYIASTSTLVDSYAQGDILYASATNEVSALAKDVNPTRVLTNTGISNNPAWAQLGLTTGVTGILPVANGGTNASSASITAFNNITGYTAAGATGTTSTNLVFSTSPTLVTPILGTPTSGTLTNCTGLPVAGGGTGLASTTAYAVLCGGTTSTAAVQSIASVGTAGQILTSNGAGALPTFQTVAASSVLVQTVTYAYSTHDGGTTTIPVDNTIPQNTEGTQLFTLAITPTNTANKLIFSGFLQCSCQTNTAGLTVALFQDTTANAIWVTSALNSAAVYYLNLPISFVMTAGTTSATTFKIRFASSTGTWYTNDYNAGGVFGGVLISRLIIQEVTS